MFLVRSTILAGALSAAVASTASATLIQMSYTGTGTGTLNGVSFLNKAFTITALADTANIGTFGIEKYNAHTSTTFTIAGVGSGSIATTLYTISVGDFPRTLDLSTATNSDSGNKLFGLDWMPFMGDAWNMQTTFSMNTGSFSYPGGTLPKLSTSAGNLKFSSFFTGAGAGTFSAVLNPVPAPGAAALIGLVGAVGARRRRA